MENHEFDNGLVVPQQLRPVRLNTWNAEIEALEAFYSGIKLPEHQVRLSKNELITCPARFVRVHLDMVKANNGNERYRPYLTRLQRFMQVMNETQNSNS